MSTKPVFSTQPNKKPINEHAAKLLAGCAHYWPSDRPLFTAAYNELCRVDLSGAKVLEVCCGHAQLALALARAFPKADVYGLDCYPEAVTFFEEAIKKEGLTNAQYICGDALRLTQFEDASLDLIYGQAALHHLAHDIHAVRREFSRVLKPGGRLVFIFEPFGHNRIWAMVRAYRFAKAQLIDESNVCLNALEIIAQNFNSCEVQPFNLLGYPFKGLGKTLGPPVGAIVHELDSALMRWWPTTARWGANFNVVFTR